MALRIRVTDNRREEGAQVKAVVLFVGLGARLSDVDIRALVEFHHNRGKLATVATVAPISHRSAAWASFLYCDELAPCATDETSFWR